MSVPTSLIGLSVAELTAVLEGTGLEPKPARMRARQLWNWTYVHGARDFASMTNLARDFRTQMTERFTLARPEIVTQQISEDGTRKFLLRTAPGDENRSARGAYVLIEPAGVRHVTLLATGSEVSLAVAAQELLAAEGVNAAVVSMPCWELFEAQPEAYRSAVLGTAPRVAVVP